LNPTMRVVSGGVLLHNVHKTKPIAFENVIKTPNPEAQTHLKECSARRQNLLQSLEGENAAAINTVTDEYLPHAIGLLESVKEASFLETNGPLSFSWTSIFSKTTSKSFTLDDLQFDVCMIMHSKAAALCSLAAHQLDGAGIAEFDEISKSAGLNLRTAAGIWDHISSNMLPLRILPHQRPLEALVPMSRAMSQLCCGQVTQIMLRKALDMGTSKKVVASLCIGCGQLFSGAGETLTQLKPDLDAVNPVLLAVTKFNPLYYKALALKCMGQYHWAEGQYGAGVAFLRGALAAFAFVKEFPGDRQMESMLGKFQQEHRATAILLQEYEKDNKAIYFEFVDMSLVVLPEGKTMVTALPYEPPAAAWRCDLLAPGGHAL